MRRKGLNICVLLAALFCILGFGACGGAPVITFSEDMPTQIECNETFDLSDYVSASDGSKLSLKAQYKDAAGLDHDYLTAGLTFKPTQPGKVTVTVYLTANREVSVSKELTVVEPYPSIVEGTEVATYFVKDTFLFEDLDKIVTYSSLTEVTFTAKSIEGNGEVVEFTDEVSYTFENVGKYTLYFEAENGRGKVNSSVVFNVSMRLTPDEEDDITNDIRQGSGSPIKFNFIEAKRENADGKKSDWHWELESSPLAIWTGTGANRNPNFDMYYVDILLPRVINLQESYITLDLNRNENCRNSVTMYYMTPGGTALVDPPLSTGLPASGEWYTYSSYNVNRTDTAVGAFRIMIHHPMPDADHPIEYDKENVRLLIDNLLIHDYTEDDFYEFENDLTNAAVASGSTAVLTKVPKTGGWYYKLSPQADNMPAGMVYMEIPTGHIDFENQYLKFDIRIPADVDERIDYILFDADRKFILGEPAWKSYYINSTNDWQTVRFEIPPEELAKVGDQQIAYVRLCITPKNNGLTVEQFYADFDNMSIETKTAAEKAEKDDLTNSAKPSGGTNSWTSVEKPEGGWYYEMKFVPSPGVSLTDQVAYMHFYTGHIDFASQYLQFDIKFEENIVKDLSYILYDANHQFILPGNWHRFSLVGAEPNADGWRTVRFELSPFDTSKTLSYIRIGINPGTGATEANFAACFDNMKIVNKTADEIAEMDDLTNAATPGDPSVAALTKVAKTEEGGWYYRLSALNDNTTADQVYMVVETGHIDFANEFLQFDIRIPGKISTKLTYILYDASGNQILSGDPWKSFFINRADGWQTVKFWIPAAELAEVGSKKISRMRICVNPIYNTLTAAEFFADFDNMQVVDKTPADRAELEDLTNNSQPSGSLNTFNRVEKSGGGWYYEMKAAEGAALADESIHMYFMTGAVNPVAQYLQFDLKITDAILDLSFTLFDTAKQQIGEEWYKYSVAEFEPNADGWRTVRLELPSFDATLSYIRIALNPSETATLDTYLACFDNMKIVDWTAEELAEKDDLTNLAQPGDPSVTAFERVDKTGEGAVGWYYKSSALKDNTPADQVYITVPTGHIDFANEFLQFDLQIPAGVDVKLTYLLEDGTGALILGTAPSAWKTYYVNRVAEWQTVKFDLPAEELAKIQDQRIARIRICINPIDNERPKEEFYAYFDNMKVVAKTAAERAESEDLTNGAKPGGGYNTFNKIEKTEGGWYYEMKVSESSGLVDNMVFMDFYTGHIDPATQYLQFAIKTGDGVRDLCYIINDGAAWMGGWSRYSLEAFEPGADGWRTVRFDFAAFEAGKTLSHIRIGINPVSDATLENFWAYFDNMEIVNKSAEELAETDDFSNNYTIFESASVTKIADTEKGGWYQRQSGTNLTNDHTQYTNSVTYNVTGIDFKTAYYKFDIRFGADAEKMIYYVFIDTNGQVVAQNGLHWVGEPVLGEGWQTVYLRKPDLSGDVRLKSIRLAFFANADAVAAQRTENLYIDVNNFVAVDYAPGEMEDKSNFWNVPTYGTLSMERVEDEEGGYWKLTNINPSDADKTNGCIHFWTGPVDFATKKLTFEIRLGEYASGSMQYVFVTQAGAGCGGWTAVNVAGDGWQTVTIEYTAMPENYYGFRLAIWPNADLTGTENLASVDIRNLNIVDKA